jgi:hypothetical protein
MYLLFMFDCYYPEGGMLDLAFKHDDLEEVKKFLHKQYFCSTTNYQIVE